MNFKIENLDAIAMTLAAKTSVKEINKQRQQGLENFYKNGLPSIKNEDWKYTSLARVAQQAYSIAETPQPVDLNIFKNYHGKDINIVFVNGILWSKLSNFEDIFEGMQIHSLQEALSGNTISLEELGAKFNTSTPNPFVDLNDALMQQGISIKIKHHTRSSKLIHIIHVAVPTRTPVLSVPRTIISLDSSAEAHILESHLTFDDHILYFTNPLTDIFIKDNATLHYCKTQRESMEAFHIGTTRVWQERGSNFDGFSLMTGGAITRNNVEVTLNGEGSTTALNGLYSVRGEQHVDNHTSIEHRVPNCTSHQLYKGILNGAARAVFNGKILVRSEAQQTNSYQLNKNLLLGKGCRVDTKPQLEIFADDVKCSHGATIGQLDEEELFYLQTRCIEKQKAIRILARGFVDDVVNTIGSEKIRNKLQCQIPH